MPVKNIKDKLIKCLYVVEIIAILAVLATIVFLKIWVIVEYGDMPITEVPSWAIPWLK